MICTFVFFVVLGLGWRGQGVWRLIEGLRYLDEGPGLRGQGSGVRVQPQL